MCQNVHLINPREAGHRQPACLLCLGLHFPFEFLSVPLRERQGPGHCGCLELPGARNQSPGNWILVGGKGHSEAWVIVPAPPHSMTMGKSLTLCGHPVASPVPWGTTEHAHSLWDMIRFRGYERLCPYYSWRCPTMYVSQQSENFTSSWHKNRAHEEMLCPLCLVLDTWLNYLWIPKRCPMRIKMLITYCMSYLMKTEPSMNGVQIDLTHGTQESRI